DMINFVVNKSTIGMGIQIIYLLLNFFRVRPVIVALQKCNVLSAAFFNRIDAIPLHADVFFAKNWFYLVGEAALVTREDVPRTIGGTIVSDDNFVFEGRLLHQDAI